jgi:hypothetical protein
MDIRQPTLFETLQFLNHGIPAGVVIGVSDYGLKAFPGEFGQGEQRWMKLFERLLLLTGNRMLA